MPRSAPTWSRLLAGLGEQGAWELVGVVADVKGGSLEEPDAIEIYVPFQRLNYPTNLAAIVRVAPRRGHPRRPPRGRGRRRSRDAAARVRPMRDAMGDTLARRKLHTLLLGCFAGSALLLALVGIYGVMSYTVGQQRHEIAIRLAMGATPTVVTRHVVGRALVLAFAGAAAGAVGALALSRVLESLLYGVSAADPRAFAAAAALQVAVAAAAAWLPARRAAKVEPMEALRS